MKTYVTISLTERQTLFLRKHFGKNKRTGEYELVRLAVSEAVKRGAEKVLLEDGYTNALPHPKESE